MTQRRVILVRHGQTEYNATGRMQGQLDTELSATGFAQARLAAKELKHLRVSHVWSSDLIRARDTATVLAEAWGCGVTEDARLRETDLGLWQGASHSEVDVAYPGQRAYWRHDPTWAPPKGETRIEVAERAFSLISELMATDAFDDGDVVIVAHGGTIGALTARLLGLPDSHFTAFSGLGNLRRSQLIARPRFVGGTGVASAPAVDGSTVPLIPNSASDWWREPVWHLEGWNIGSWGDATSPQHLAAGPGSGTGRATSNPDEGGE